LKILECLWLDRFVDKIIQKHNIYPDEVEEVFSSKPKIWKVEKGDVKGENLYVAFGKTNGGRHLSVLFVRKKDQRALVISARDMTSKERKRHGKE
jgi:uncharacterized DUF497 family protein